MLVRALIAFEPPPVLTATTWRTWRVVHTHCCVYNTQMISTTLTVSDLCRVTGYTRDQMRGLLAEAMCEQSSKGARIAREFNAHQLMAVTVMAELESKLGIKRSHIAGIAKRLTHALSGPRLVNPHARLFVTFDPPKVIYIGDDTLPPNDGLVMCLGRIFERVDRYLASGSAGLPQSHLRLGPAVIRRRKDGGKA
jgi:hypothetical protein